MLRLMKYMGVAVCLLLSAAVQGQDVEFNVEAPSVVASGEAFRIEFSLNAKPSQFTVRHKHISFFCAAHYRQQPAFVLACERQNQIACFHIGCQTQPPSGSVSITAPSSVTAIVCS